jgi:hypothetical protein
MPRNPQSVLIRRRWNLTRRENTLLPSILISLTLAFAVSRYLRHPRAPPRHPRHLEDAEAVRARSRRRRASSVTMSSIWANAHGRIKVEVVTARLRDPPRLSPQGTSCSPLLRIWFVAVRASACVRSSRRALGSSSPPRWVETSSPRGASGLGPGHAPTTLGREKLAPWGAWGARPPNSGHDNSPRSPRAQAVQSGGAEGTRTPDPHTASVMRYQLRHSPEVNQLT